MFRIRTANENDVLWLFNLANDPAARKNSHHTESISYRTHLQWFKNQTENLNAIILIIEQDIVPLAVVRFSNDENVWFISINLDPKWRGKGYASQIIKETVNYFFNNVTCRELFAQIKYENVASQKAFEKAGFKLEDSLVVKGINTLQYKLSKADYEKLDNKN